MINFGFQSGGGGGSTPVVLPYGSYFNRLDQNCALANRPQAMELNSSFFEQFVSIQNDLSGNPTQITVAETGIYNIQFSAQIRKSAGGGTQDIDIWLSKNNVDEPFSATKLTLANNGHYVVGAWNWFVQLNAGEFAEIIWSVTDLSVYLEADSTHVPAIPSLITTICRVDGNS